MQLMENILKIFDTEIENDDLIRAYQQFNFNSFLQQFNTFYNSWLYIWFYIRLYAALM